MSESWPSWGSDGVDDAIAAIIEQAKKEGDMAIALLSELFPQLDDVQVCPYMGTPLELTDSHRCRQPCYETQYDTLANCLIHLNDDHLLDREGIADFIDTLGNTTIIPASLGD